MDGSPPHIDAPALCPPPKAARAAKGGKTLALLARIRESGLPPPQRLVLVMLASRVGWKSRKGRPGGTCTPETATIAEDTGLARSTVCEAIKALRLAGWLQVEKRSVDHMKTSNRYRITPPPLP